ncbi:ankyrin repeat domain-containing protein [Actinoplanes sp. NPDC089786]|uniref:ankyrin repeat domain-containing protein n=1 Tax=Actinoplanes sp. NPDC089786 TaxID=3155185 RepID=UPI0034343543
MPYRELIDLVLAAPGPAAPAGAVTVLRELADDEDLGAVTALGVVLTAELGLDAWEPPELADPADLLHVPGVPDLVRAYLIGFYPRLFHANVIELSTPAAEWRTPAGLIRLQRLGWRGAAMRHEALLAYLTQALTDHAVFRRDVLGIAPDALVQVILRQIHQGARIVDGHSIDHSFEAGLEWLLSVDADTFSLAIQHEFGHYHTDLLAAAPDVPVEPEDRRRLIAEVRRLAGGAPPFELVKSGAGPVQMLWSSGPYLHVSFSRFGRPIGVDEAAELALLTGAVAGADPELAAAAYSKAGIFHVGFAGGTALRTAGLWWPRRKQEEQRLMDEARDRAPGWLAGLRARGRVGRTERDVSMILGATPRQARWFVSGPLAHADLHASASGRPHRASVRCADAATLGRPDPAEAGRLFGELASASGVVRDGSSTRYAGATANGARSVLSALCDAGFDIDTTLDGTGTTLLVDAAGRNSDLVEFVLGCGADPDRADRRGRTALVTATLAGRAASVRRLLEAGADPDRCDGDGRTALVAAVVRDELEIVAVLLALGARPDAATATGQTPLAMARSTGAVAALCRAGASVHAADPAGVSALTSAAAAGSTEAVAELLRRGADVDRPTALGQTALHGAAGCRAEGPSGQIIDLLIAAGADPDEEDSDGHTPLMYAARDMNPTGVERLVAAGADVNREAKSGSTAIMWAVTAETGWSRDFMTVFARQRATVEALLAAGADVIATDTEGRTAADLSTSAAITELLREHARG